MAKASIGYALCASFCTFKRSLEQMEKLVDLAGSQQTSALSKRFSSHPDSAMRAERMRKKADAATKK